jgi:hypothetical protein
VIAQRLSGRGQEGEISLGGIDGTFDKKSDWIINIFFHSCAENGIADMRR